MSTLTALLLILFGFALAVSILLWAAVRPKLPTDDAPPAPRETHKRPANPKPQPRAAAPAQPADRPTVRLRQNRLAPPPASKADKQESDAFKRFLQSDD